MGTYWHQHLPERLPIHGHQSASLCSALRIAWWYRRVPFGHESDHGVGTEQWGLQRGRNQLRLSERIILLTGDFQGGFPEWRLPARAVYAACNQHRRQRKAKRVPRAEL